MSNQVKFVMPTSSMERDRKILDAEIASEDEDLQAIQSAMDTKKERIRIAKEGREILDKAINFKDVSHPIKSLSKPGEPPVMTPPMEWVVIDDPDYEILRLSLSFLATHPNPRVS